MLSTALRGISLGAVLLFSLAAHAQDYPSKPIKIIVSVPPGGSVDAIARLVAEKLRQKWGQPVLVENRPGAANNIGAEAVFKAPADGYTLLFAPEAPFVINKTLFKKLAYDPDALTPVSLVAANPQVLIVHPKVPAQTLQQLIQHAKANPGKLNYASGGSGTSVHLTAELFQSVAGINLTHIPYKGVAPAVTGVLGGQVDMMFVDVSTALPHIRSGAVRVLVVAHDKRIAALPEVPASPEVAPGLLAQTWFGMAAPPATPAAIVNRLSAAIAEGLKQPDVAQRLSDMGNITAIGSTPEEMTAFMRKDSERWAKLIRATGATAE
jgi:tripartite-type tricarboxylate transporter receptor subunit TctC